MGGAGQEALYAIITCIICRSVFIIMILCICVRDRRKILWTIPTVCISNIIVHRLVYK